MKSGTTALCRDLSEHPAIFMSPIKEPGYFSHEENRSSLEKYRRLFARASDQAYLMEGSTEYTMRPHIDGVADRIQAFNPGARFIYLMRDPLSRVVSHYRQLVRKGWEKRSLPLAVRHNCQYLSIGYYAYQVRPYLERFGPDAVFMETFEAFTASPSSFYQSLFNWLGIDASVLPHSAGKPLNENPDAIEAYDEQSYRVRLARMLTPHLRQHPRLARLLPQVATRWYRRILPKESVRKADSHDFAREVEETRHLVQPVLAEWISELEELTGCCYREWPSRESDRSQDESGQMWLQESLCHRLPHSMRVSRSGPPR
jgi:hypothetical protein